MTTCTVDPGMRVSRLNRASSADAWACLLASPLSDWCRLLRVQYPSRTARHRFASFFLQVL